jgi:dihydroorotate dehydrogenase
VSRALPNLENIVPDDVLEIASPTVFSAFASPTSREGGSSISPTDVRDGGVAPQPVPHGLLKRAGHQRTTRPRECATLNLNAMPDWSYQNLFRPALFRLPPARARDLTLGTVGRLASTRSGRTLIEFMGHMTPPAGAGTDALGGFQSRVVLTAGLDPGWLGLNALARFGVGAIEVGPVTLEGAISSVELQRDALGCALEHSHPASSLSVHEALRKLQKLDAARAKVIVRLGHDDLGAERETLRLLEPHADALTIMPPLSAYGELQVDLNEWRDHIRTLARDTTRPLLVLVPLTLEPSTLELFARASLEAGAVGFALLDGLPTRTGWRLGPEAFDLAVRFTKMLRGLTDAPILSSGGISEPSHAIQLLAAGANLVGVHAGLVFSGPGLPKRINAAIAARATESLEPPTRQGNWLTQGWFWLLAFGLGMIISGLTVGLVGATRATMPYDETFLGLSRAQFELINPRLLDFLRHDRVTLAGAVIAPGLIYALLAVFGVRRGLHWAWRSIFLSATIGFASFFLFALYGYFDVLHALVSLILLPFLVIGLRKPIPLRRTEPALDLQNDRVWRAGLIGQLLFVATGLGLILAGASIAGVGAIRVFVPEDLEFMRTTRDALGAANAHLIALIAHDRSGFGGALWSTGIAVLTTALWGFERGARWLWWTLAGAGSVGFIATLGIHFWVGYTSLPHLLPAYIGLWLFVMGLAFSGPYLFGARVSKPFVTPSRKAA